MLDGHICIEKLTPLHTADAVRLEFRWVSLQAEYLAAFL